jgi:hypothetical protein
MARVYTSGGMGNRESDLALTGSRKRSVHASTAGGSSGGAVATREGPTCGEPAHPQTIRTSGVTPKA